MSVTAAADPLAQYRAARGARAAAASAAIDRSGTPTSGASSGAGKG